MSNKNAQFVDEVAAFDDLLITSMSMCVTASEGWGRGRRGGRRAVASAASLGNSLVVEAEKRGMRTRGLFLTQQAVQLKVFRGRY